MPPKKSLKIPPRALKRGAMLWSKEFTEGIAADMAEWADPAFMKLFMEFCYGGLYDRKVLPQKTRELCAVAACVMANAHPQLRTHVQAAWNCGATKREIMEVILQMATYCGMPYMLQCARVANGIFPDLKRGKKAGALPSGLKVKKTTAKKTRTKKAKAK
jgi:4-carboxymuconolactone decarboxylase